MKILLACGGTGGHLFPGVALAEEFEDQERGEVVFVGTPRGLEKEVLGKRGWKLRMMDAISLADKKGFKKLLALFALLKAMKQAHRILKEENPDIVIGVGGYAAGPMLMMAALLCKPTLTLEPNAVPGLANRILKYFVDRVVVAYPGMEKFFGKKKTRLLGIPVRRNILNATAHRTWNLEHRTIFVFGGSQGAKTINEGILAQLSTLDSLKNKIHFVHQIGRKASQKDYEKAYLQAGFSAEVYPFIENMGTFYAKADFVISRAGAVTLAELIALKKPSILIPYPFAAAGHQEANARSLEKLGGAIVVSDSEAGISKMGEAIRRLVEKKDLLQQMENNLAKLAQVPATKEIVRECLQLVHA